MEVVAVFTIVLIILVIGLFMLYLGSTPTKKEDTSSDLNSQEFIPSQVYLDSGGGNGIAINETTKKLCIMKSADAAPRYFFSKDLLASVLSKNGAFLLQRFRTVPAGIVALVKQLEPQLNTMVTSEASEPSQSNQTQKIDLWLLVNDEEEPIHVVNFLDMDAKEGGVIYVKAMNNAKHWHHLLSGFVDLADSHAHLLTPELELEPDSSSQLDPQQNLIAEELTKLSNLLDKKLLTQEEFNAQKEKLLAAQ